eukprot:365254-Chlamydomonas_euryale.AAC.10
MPRRPSVSMRTHQITAGRHASRRRPCTRMRSKKRATNYAAAAKHVHAHTWNNSRATCHQAAAAHAHARNKIEIQIMPLRPSVFMRTNQITAGRRASRRRPRMRMCALN